MSALCFILGVVVFEIFFWLSGFDYTIARGPDLTLHIVLMFFSGYFGVATYKIVKGV